MGQLLVRGLDDKIIEMLKRRAHMSGRSVEAEHRAILEQALPLPQPETFIEVAARLRAELPKSKVGSGDIIRECRDRTWQMKLGDPEP